MSDRGRVRVRARVPVRVPAWVPAWESAWARVRSRARAEEGSATAELAVALPAVVLVLAACVGALQVAAAQVRLQDAASLAARAASRGGDPGSAGATTPGAALHVWREGALVCASASGEARWAPGLPPLVLAARSCALSSAHG